jgi:hypothetical protein
MGPETRRMDIESNPYAPGSGARPPLLAGRGDELALLDELIIRTSAGLPGRGIVLTGLRGVGKTVLLDRLRRRAEDAGWLTVGIDGQSGESGRSCVRRQLAQGLSLAARRLQRVGLTERVRAALATVRSFGMAIGGVSIDLGVEASVGRADTGIAEIDLQETIGDLTPALVENGAALLLVIDEVQDVDLDLLGALLTAQHTACRTEQPFFIVAAGLPNSAAVLCEARSYAGRMFSFRRIEALDPATAADAVRTPARAIGMDWDDDALECVVRCSGGYPIHLQTFAAFAWSTALSGSAITLADAEAGVERGQADLDAGFFPSWWERANDVEQEYLRIVARHAPEPVRPSDVDPDDRVASVATSLIRKGLLFEPVPGRVALTVPRFESFVSARQSLGVAV